MLHLILWNHHHFEAMKVSESIVNNLLIEIDYLTYRVRRITQCYKMTSNKSLRERLIDENKNIIGRIIEINKASKFLSALSNDKISFSALLEEKSKRTLEEIRTESNLFI